MFSKEYLLWKSFIQRIVPFEKRFATVMRNLFAQQEKEILSKINNNSLLRLETVTKAKDSINIYLASLELDVDKWNKTFIISTTPLYTEVVKKMGQKVFTDLGLGIDFDITSPEITKFIKDKTIKFSGFVNGETNRKLNDALKPILEEGGSVIKVSKKIRDKVAEKFHGSVRATKGRSETIARTEMVGAGNGGSFEAAKQSKVVAYKAWLPSFDDRVRATHKQAGKNYPKTNGIPIDKPFKVGEALLNVPGVIVGGSNTVKEVINCRCSWLPVRAPR